LPAWLLLLLVPFTLALWAKLEAVRNLFEALATLPLPVSVLSSAGFAATSQEALLAHMLPELQLFLRVLYTLPLLALPLLLLLRLLGKPVSFPHAVSWLGGSLLLVVLVVALCTGFVFLFPPSKQGACQQLDTRMGRLEQHIPSICHLSIPTASSLPWPQNLQRVPLDHAAYLLKLQTHVCELGRKVLIVSGARDAGKTFGLSYASDFWTQHQRTVFDINLKEVSVQRPYRRRSTASAGRLHSTCPVRSCTRRPILRSHVELCVLVRF
jgi:hypothetical protein